MLLWVVCLGCVLVWCSGIFDSLNCAGDFHFNGGFDLSFCCGFFMDFMVVKA